MRPERLVTVPATELARECLGRPLPNAALLGGFAALTGVVSLASVAAAIRERFAGEVGERNVRAAERAHALVAAAKEPAHA
jgi:pyruvate ferredoxin oxidoreductase gamma subunit